MKGKIATAAFLAALAVPGIAQANSTHVKVDVNNITCTGATVTTGQTQGPDPRLVARVKVDGVPYGDRLYSDPFEPSVPQNWNITFQIPEGHHTVQVNAYVEDNDQGVYGA